MANVSEPSMIDHRSAGPSVSSRGGPGGGMNVDLHSASVDSLILLLRQPRCREETLSALLKKRETCKELAELLWNSFDTVYILLQEVLAVYKLLSSSELTRKDSDRVCDVLALFQCIAANPATRIKFFKAKLPVYFYPLLSTTNTAKPFDFLRSISLCVIGTLVKVNDPICKQVIIFFLETELFPLCLRCMELGSEVTQRVATFIVLKILMHDEGLHYCCAYADRFYAVGRVLAGLIPKAAERPSEHLLRDVIGCYLRLSEIRRASAALSRCFPSQFKQTAFINALRDPDTKRMLQTLLCNVAMSNLGITVNFGRQLRH